MEDHVGDIMVAFDIPDRARMKLNFEKYTFGVKARKFLDFMIFEKGIEANPEKIKAILDMQSPKIIKKVQMLNGRIQH